MSKWYKNQVCKLVIIVGPTSSGKSEIAVRLAKKLNGEIISADSRQIYHGLNIGTGKVPGKWAKVNVATNTRPRVSCNIFLYKRIPHYCIDFASPKKTYTVAEYKKRAEAAIKDITSRGKIPIIAGGTGFWIDTVVYDLNLPEVPPNPRLRKKLEKKTAPQLLKILQKLDPGRAKTIEQKNSRRLIRAIEIAKTLGKVPKIKKRSPYNTLWLGIKRPPDTLKTRIKKRLDRRIKNGMINEARRLKKIGLPWRKFYELGLEYKFLAYYLQKKISKNELAEKILAANNDYARRQMVWFKRNKEIHWISDLTEAMRLSKKFLTGIKNSGKK